MYRARLRAGGLQRDFDYSPRDLQILHSKQWPEGNELLLALGIYANFSVAGGMDTATWTTRNGAKLVTAISDFEQAVRAQSEFLHHDYLYRMPADRTWLKRSRTSFPLGENRGEIHAGAATLFVDVTAGEEGNGPLLERIDLRGSASFAVTENAKISIKRIAAASRWPEILPSMREFLAAVDGAIVEASHALSDK